MYLDIEYLFFRIYVFIADVFNFLSGQSEAYSEVYYWWKIIAVIFSVALVAGIAFNLFDLFKLNRKQLSAFIKTILEEPPHERATRWDRIKKYLESTNSSDWRRAILEADNLVDDIIKKLGYAGDTFGDRLSKIDRRQFKSLDEIWTAHKVRNRIAHEPDYNLTKSEAEQAVELFETALKELEYL